MNVDPRRVRKLNNIPEARGTCVIYWMQRDMRAHDNWALFYAQYEAQRLRVPLITFYGLVPQFLDASMRHYLFFIEGLKDVEQILNSRDIGFIVEAGELPGTLLKVSARLKPILVVCDHSPLRITRLWRARAAKTLNCPLVMVDAHNIVPVWEASNCEEMSLKAMRGKVASKLDEYLVTFPRLNRHPFLPPKIKPVNWGRLAQTLQAKDLGAEISKRLSGVTAAKHTLKSFVINRLTDYSENRFNPNVNILSGLSPYINFGQLSAQRAALEVVEARLAHKSLWEPAKAFIEELIVHRELAENYCFYNRFYDKLEGFPKWARETLSRHAKDKRPFIYNFKEFEKAATHDMLWNAAQKQAIATGKMHSYMRTYWAKKILEWSSDPESAIRIAITLNNRYELDGRDPSSYAGIAWCIGGVHDRPCQEREIFGAVRYLDEVKFKRSFNVETYIDRYV